MLGETLEVEVHHAADASDLACGRKHVHAGTAESGSGPDLAPDQTRTIRVILSVAPAAAPFAALSATAAAVLPGELETHNNQVEVITRTETSVFLPVALR